MSNGELARIRYYKGQMLTARDFDDQQEYHRQKLKHLLQRFPPGIIGGLNVTCEKKKDENPSDFDGFLIGPGLALDQEGNEIVVPEPGFKAPVSKFDPLKPYLSLVYFQETKFVGNGLCADNQKHNRIRESFDTRWDAAPNLASGITVALIKPKKEGTEQGSSCDDFEIKLVEDEGGPRIRLDARFVDTEQISNGAITEQKIRNNAVTRLKILDGAITGEKFADGAVIEDKLSNGVKNKLVTDGNAHDHTGGHGNLIPEAGLQDDVKGKLVLKGSKHDHSDGDGALIPETGLHPDVRDKLNSIIGKNHNHTGGQGGLIPVKGLAADVLEKLVTRGDKHDHTAKHEAPIPKAGLDKDVHAELVTGGDGHNHTDGHGAPIPKGGLDKGAVMPENLSLIKDLPDGTVGAQPEIITIPNVPRNAFIQVVPTTQGTLSWTFKVGFVSNDSLSYEITIVKESSDPVVKYQIRAIAFN